MALARLRTGIAHVVEMFEDKDIDDKDAIIYLKEMNRVENQNVRVPSAYNLFVRERLNSLKEAGVPNKERMSIISNKWKQLPDNEKAPYIEKRQAMINEKNNQMKTLKNTITNKTLVRIIQPRKSKKNDTTNATTVTTVVRVRENSPIYSPRNVIVPSPEKSTNKSPNKITSKNMSNTPSKETPKETPKETAKETAKEAEKAPERPVMPFVNKAKYDLPKKRTMTVTEEEIEHERERKERRRIKKEKIAAKQKREQEKEQEKKQKRKEDNVNNNVKNNVNNDRPSEIQSATDQDEKQKTDDEYNEDNEDNTSGEESPVSPLSQSSASEQEEQKEHQKEYQKQDEDDTTEKSEEDLEEKSEEDDTEEEETHVITQPVKAASSGKASTSAEASTSAQAPTETPTTWVISRSTASTSQKPKNTKKTAGSKSKKGKKPPKEESEESEWASDDPRYDDDYVPEFLLSRNQPILAPAGPPIRIKTWSLDKPDSEEERENEKRCMQGFNDLVREHPEYMYDSEEGCTKGSVVYESDSDDDVDPKEMAEANEHMMRMMRKMEERNAIALARNGSNFLDNP